MSEIKKKISIENRKGNGQNAWKSGNWIKLRSICLEQLLHSNKEIWPLASVSVAKSLLEDHLLNVKLTEWYFFFLAALEWSAVDCQKSFTRKWWTSTRQCILGTIQDGGWELAKQCFSSHISRTKELLCQLRIRVKKLMNNEFWMARLNMSMANYFSVSLF